jgi:hypothetical protein
MSHIQRGSGLRGFYLEMWEDKSKKKMVRENYLSSKKFTKFAWLARVVLSLSTSRIVAVRALRRPE